jgi:hypothetical protein
LLPLAGPLARLAELARPEQRAVLEQLPARIGLAPSATVDDVRRRLEVTEAEIAAATARLSDATQQNTDSLDAVRADLRRTWPELDSTYAPLAVALASERADEFVAKVMSLDSYRAYRDAHAAEARAIEARLDADRMEAKVQRLLRTCEEIVLAANLPKVAAPEIVTRYEKILASEAGTLAPLSPTAR